MPGQSMGGVGGIISELISPTKYPKVPASPFVDPQSAQLAAIHGNMAALSPLEQLASGVNTFNLGQRQNAVNASIPGFSTLASTASGNLTDWLRGTLAPDVSAQVTNSAAAKALAGGYGLSPAANALSARDLGLTSLQLQEQGQRMLPGYLNMMGNLMLPQEFNLGSMMLTPEQQIAQGQWNESSRYGQQWLQNQISALPDPMMQQVGNLVGGLANTVMDLGGVTSVLGSGGGGMGGMMGGSGGAGMLGGLLSFI